LAWLFASSVCGLTGVVGGDHQHDDVGQVGAAPAHRRGNAAWPGVETTMLWPLWLVTL